MTTAPDLPRVFVDTSVLVYSSIATAPFHAQAITRLEGLWDQQTELWISRQALREYLAVLSRPQTFTNPLSAESPRCWPMASAAC